MAILIVLLITIMVILFVCVQMNSSNLITKKASEKSALFAGQYKHCVGLPELEINVWMYQYADSILIASPGSEYRIEYNKISDISSLTESEISKQYVSSVGGAVAGAIFLGPIGAIIAGRPKVKTSSTEKKYLIITYMNRDNEISSIGLEETNISISNKIKFIAYFKNNKKSDSLKVDL